MKKPRICAVIVNSNLEALREIEPLVDLFEVRIDLIGDDWPELVRQLTKPWIACNRITDEGGQWRGSEARRVEQLLHAIELGADIVDIEMATANLNNIIPIIKKRAQCLLSFHDMQKTPSLEEMREMIKKQQKAGADICKVVTTAREFDDNLAVLKLIAEFPETRLISLAMGSLGTVSRVLCPLVGGEFTYASIEKGDESAPGQITVRELVKIYEMMGVK